MFLFRKKNFLLTYLPFSAVVPGRRMHYFLLSFVPSFAFSLANLLRVLEVDLFSGYIRKMWIFCWEFLLAILLQLVNKTEQWTKQQRTSKNETVPKNLVAVSSRRTSITASSNWYKLERKFYLLIDHPSCNFHAQFSLIFMSFLQQSVKLFFFIFCTQYFTWSWLWAVFLCV